MDDIPRIPLRMLREGNDTERRWAVGAFNTGFRHHDAAVVGGHGIPRETVERARAEAERFFASHPEANGSCDVGSAARSEDDHPAALRELYVALERVGLTLLDALDAFLREEPRVSFAGMGRDGDSVLRVDRSPPLDSVPPASDVDLLTVILPGVVPESGANGGFLVQAPNGRWSPVAVRADELLVGAGDMLAWMTAGRVPVTRYRVEPPRDAAAPPYRFLFFVRPRPDAMLSILSAYRGANQPPDVTAEDFLKQRLARLLP